MYSNCESTTLPIYKPSQLEVSRFRLIITLPWNIVHLLQSSQRCIIAHYGTFRKCWDSVILTAILYVATIVPYNAAFFKSENNNTYTMTVSILMFRDFVGSCHQQKVEASLVFDGLIEAIFILGIIF